MSIPEFLIPLLLAVIPGIEVRGAVLYSSFRGLGWFEGYVLPFIVSMAIVPLVYLGFEYILEKFMKLKFVQRKVMTIRAKVSKYVDKYGFWGLMLFVAIPLPGSGLYTGTLGALILGLEEKKAIPALYLGNLLAFLFVFAMTRASLFSPVFL